MFGAGAKRSDPPPKEWQDQYRAKGAASDGAQALTGKDQSMSEHRTHQPRWSRRHRDAITVRRVYGDPIERDGTWSSRPLRSAAAAAAAAASTPKARRAPGTGFGLHARPVGAFVIRGGDVRWEPVDDPPRPAHDHDR